MPTVLDIKYFLYSLIIFTSISGLDLFQRNLVVYDGDYYLRVGFLGGLLKNHIFQVVGSEERIIIEGVILHFLRISLHTFFLLCLLIL